MADRRMYVCICNGFTEKQVERVLAQGVRSTAGVYRALGCQPQCGKCVPEVRHMVNQAKAEDCAAYAIAAE